MSGEEGEKVNFIGIVGLRFANQTYGTRSNKMKKIILLIFILSFPFHAIAEEKNIDGYMWESLEGNDMYKEIFIAGYMHGYNAGYKYGGSISSIKVFDMIFGNLTEKKGDYKVSNQCIIENKVAKEDLGQTIGASFIYPNFIGTNRLEKSATFYKNELDSFFKTFPLCKKKELLVLLADLSIVWGKEKNFTYTYKEIADSCLKLD